MTKLRRLYETPDDRKAEEAVIREMCKRRGHEWWKLPMTYRVDYAVTTPDDEILMWLEVKCRSKKEDIKLSLHKVMAGLELSRVTGLPFILAVAFGEEIYWKKILPGPMQIAMWGRIDRNDWQDTEPMVLFPLNDFIPFRPAQKE